MSILSEKGASSYELGFVLTVWALNFFISLGGLFISMFIFISHDDMQMGVVEPADLCNNIQAVLVHFHTSSSCLMSI